MSEGAYTFIIVGNDEYSGPHEPTQIWMEGWKYMDEEVVAEYVVLGKLVCCGERSHTAI